MKLTQISKPHVSELVANHRGHTLLVACGADALLVQEGDEAPVLHGTGHEIRYRRQICLHCSTMDNRYCKCLSYLQY